MLNRFRNLTQNPSLSHPNLKVNQGS
uniref:Uncharacterized protein n=1 Tax=Arundo donax TaxID=35708 RepID=A0A0A9DUP3_ARUDO